jgi:D-glycero-alpha-D-manno-heptose 1-phosphate guanylyltransferase
VKALVLAGGRGTRLGELTRELPKPMLPVAGRPFLEYPLERLAAAGFEEIILSVGYRARALEAHFGGRFQGVPLRYAIEPEPLGTGGAIAFALRDEPARPVLVANGDTFLAIDYAALIAWHAAEPGRPALVVRRVDDAARYGTVKVRGDTVTAFAEKGVRGAALVSAGAYILRPELFGTFGLGGRFSVEADLFQRHCARLQLRAYIFDGYFIDVGVPEELERAQRELAALSRPLAGHESGQRFET